MKILLGNEAEKAEAGSIDGDDDEEEEEQDGLKAFEEVEGDCKLVLIVRTDLGMNKGSSPCSPSFPHPSQAKKPPPPTGKIAAQASHATLYNYKVLTSHKHLRPLLRRWESTGQAKIAVQTKSEEQLEELHAKAMSLGLVARIVRDAGRTQIPAGSATVLGVGPGPKGVVDEVSGELKLL